MQLPEQMLRLYMNPLRNVKRLEEYQQKIREAKLIENTEETR